MKRLERVLKVCPCGKEMQVKPWLVDRKKYCSQACKYKYRIRPTGLDYDIKVVNKAWFIKGQTHLNVVRGEAHSFWKGDNCGYDALHDWVYKKLGRPTECELCHTSEGRIEWANKSHEYKRELDDWLMLCRFCHRKHDREHRGAIKRRFPEYACARNW